MEELPRFELFEDPVGEKSIEESRKKCAACGRRRGWVYALRTYGPGDNGRPLCPWCIADGSAAAKLGCSFNEGTIFPCLPGTPQLSEADRELVENRTPGFVTWQDHGWQMCCGRACVYVGEAKPGDLLEGGKWATAAASITEGLEALGWSKEQERELLENVGHGDPGGFVFRCRVCGGFRGFWDCS